MQLEKLLWSKISQGLVRTDGIIHLFPLHESLVEFGDVKRDISYLTEFLVKAEQLELSRRA